MICATWHAVGVGGPCLLLHAAGLGLLVAPIIARKRRELLECWIPCIGVGGLWPMQGPNTRGLES